MPETITIDVPRQGIGEDLTKALAEHGLEAVVLDEDDRLALVIRFADDEHERLLDGAVHAIELFLSDRMLPLVVQRANGGAVVRPPGD